MTAAQTTAKPRKFEPGQDVVNVIVTRKGERHYPARVIAVWKDGTVLANQYSGYSSLDTAQLRYAPDGTGKGSTRGRLRPMAQGETVKGLLDNLDRQRKAREDAQKAAENDTAARYIAAYYRNIDKWTLAQQTVVRTPTEHRKEVAQEDEQLYVVRHFEFVTSGTFARHMFVTVSNREVWDWDVDLSRMQPYYEVSAAVLQLSRDNTGGPIPQGIQAYRHRDAATAIGYIFDRLEKWPA